MDCNVYMLNLFGELEVWYNEWDFILGKNCDYIIVDKKEIDIFLGK